MPGCGKSTFGRKAAASLDLPFFDLDKEIIRNENMDINSIFQQKGEEYFRGVESSLLKQVTVSNSSFVMATGGGTPCFADNIDFMNARGLTIYIRATVEDLLERLSEKGLKKRPLLKEVAPEELRAKLASQLQSRKSYYEKCQHILAYHSSMESEIVDVILKNRLSE